MLSTLTIYGENGTRVHIFFGGYPRTSCSNDLQKHRIIFSGFREKEVIFICTWMHAHVNDYVFYSHSSESFVLLPTHLVITAHCRLKLVFLNQITAARYWKTLRSSIRQIPEKRS